MATVKVKSNLKLYAWQLQVFRELETHWKGYIHVIKSKRQCGKSIMIQTLLLQTAINKPKSVSILLSTTKEQARKIYDAIKEVVLPTKLYKKHNDTHLTLHLTNGSEILFKSGEQRVGLKGFTVTGIYCVDEAAYIPDDIFFDTLAWVNVSQAPIVICSTPNHKTGFFYQHYSMGLENGNDIISYDWSLFDTSVLLPDSKLEQYRLTVPAPKFKTDFLGEFLDNESAVFGDYSAIISNEYEDTGECYMGVDWATGNGKDDTAIVLFNSKRQMMKIWNFNDKDETATINFIIDIMKEYKPKKCQVEMNSIGSVFYGLLDKAVKAAKLNVMLLKFYTTNDSKEKIINNFQVLIQNKRVSILNNPTLMVQMDMFEVKVNKNQKRIYNAASGYHDDIIMAMLIALDSMGKGTYVLK